LFLGFLTLVAAVFDFVGAADLGDDTDGDLLLLDGVNIINLEIKVTIY
jgi:hypothetical protein